MASRGPSTPAKWALIPKSPVAAGGLPPGPHSAALPSATTTHDAVRVVTTLLDRSRSRTTGRAGDAVPTPFPAAPRVPRDSFIAAAHGRRPPPPAPGSMDSQRTG